MFKEGKALRKGLSLKVKKRKHEIPPLFAGLEGSGDMLAGRRKVTVGGGKKQDKKQQQRGKEGKRYKVASLPRKQEIKKRG